MSSVHPTSQVTKGPWLFGPVADPAVFLSGPLAAWVYIAASPGLTGGARWHIDVLVVAIGIVVLDRAHTFATFLRVFGSPIERQRHGARVGFLALALFALFFGVHLVSRDFFWTAATYLTVWHVLKQHVGLALYAESASTPLRGKFERTFASLHLYLLWGGTLLSLHARENPTLGWYSTSELIPFPSATWPLAVGVSVAGVLCYFAFVVWRFIQSRIVPRASLVVWASSFGGSAVLWTQNPAQDRVSLILALSVLHSIPYLSACWMVAQKSKVQNVWLETVRPSRVPVGIAFLFVTLVIGASWQIVGFSMLESLQAGSSRLSNGVIISLAEVIFMLPVVVHNVADAWLWKRTENPDVLMPLFASEEARAQFETPFRKNAATADRVVG